MSMKSIDGVNIRNARRDLALHISPGDISISKKKDHAHCVISEAVRREHKVADVRVYLSRTFIRFKGANEYLRYETPKSLYREIIAFDRGGNFEPGTYELLKPGPGVLRHKPTGRKDGKPVKKTRPRRFTANVRSAGTKNG